MEGFQINYTDIYDLFWEYKTNLENLMNKIDTCENCINFFQLKCSVYRRNRRCSKKLSDRCTYHNAFKYKSHSAEPA